MPKQRVQTDLGLRPERLRPAASPVDRFVSSGPPSASALGQLADALGEIAPEIQRFGAVKGKRDAEKAQREGQEAARQAQAEGKEYLAAIKDGTIHPSQSPWFRLGFDQQFGRVAAQKYAAAFQVEMATALSDATDIEDFDAVEREFRAKWVADHIGEDDRGLNFDEAFGVTVDGALDGLRRNFASQAGQRMVAQSNDLLHAEVMGIVLGPSENQAAEISLAIDRVLAQGTFKNPGAANRVVVDAITNAARRANDPALLQLLDSIVTDKKSRSKLSGTKYAAEAIEEAENAIASGLRQEWNFEQSQDAARKNERVEALASTAIQGVLDGSLGADDFGKLVAEVAAINPGYATTLLESRERILTGTNINNPASMDAAFNEIWTGKMGKRGVLGLLNAGEINSQGANFLLNQVQERNDAGGSGNAAKALSDPIFRAADRNFQSQFGDEMDWDAEVATRRFYATTEFYTEWSRWWAANPNATLDEKQTFIERLVETQKGKWATEVAQEGAAEVPGTAFDWRTRRWFSEPELQDIERWTQLPSAVELSDSTIDKMRTLGITGAEVAEMITSQRSLIARR